ncbi:MAG TPA: folylpolyglutamate synthase/dihydrofolate synthase family protein [Silvibacterium sp.]|jgi:dihydrofolate synthase/folylpolyglutamate synthase|nr:folylpolyglutamate synthase/dihydrofolate synthase family protein [Silvibacterium sp.]
MSYAAAIEGLFSLAGELHASPGQPRRKFELSKMRVLAEGLGYPEHSFPSVLVAGTNGKGSTSATLASILMSAGYRTGLYTSPHLSRVNERVQIDGVEISDDDFAAYYFRVDDCARQMVSEGRLDWHPSFFETMTALAFLAFAEKKVDIAVLEVGMGGRLDATNIVEPVISVITDISLDHTEWLGSTIAEIAREKGGILRRDGVLVTLSQHPEANQAIGETAEALHVRGVNAAAYVPVRDAAMRGDKYWLTVMDEQIEIQSPLKGVHQQRNVALAIAAAVELRNYHGYNISAAQIGEGIRRTQWPGRLERFQQTGRADVLLDVAHNPAGAWALRSALSHLDPEPRIMTAVFGCLRDKAFGEMAQILFPLFETVVLTEVDSPRRATLAEMEAAGVATGVRMITAEGVRDALKQAWALTPVDGLVVVTGSIYLVGAVRPLVGAVRAALTEASR